MSSAVKPLTHWVIYKGYKVRFTSRSAQLVTGILTTGAGATLSFQYEPALQIVHLPGEHIKINEFGWEIERVAHD